MRTLTTTAIAVLATTVAVTAAEVAPKEVKFDEYGSVETSLTGTPGDPENGAVIMKTKSMGNCISCHQVTALEDAPFHGEIGPMLDGAGDRWTEADLRGIVSNAKKTFPGTMMPAYYKVDGYIRPGDAFTGKAAEEPLPPLLSGQQVEDVVAFLMTLKEE
ncbi:sulfur oxidation c-type cytochrome SoxX [Roseovarius indicus]|jgi:sulfur-oxidizing protein SoxX|uniref:Cytochrome c n=1 Tax=Roseovarius indicus TaxID=540747 RepID=A0A0T5PDD2_9RHOB|nr:sulfur oxidation c-type cytochrome SoxX [Roseovarius indicus]KRS19052.1 monoheme cytochrome C SoxX [Roseovarius indicus]OAO07379.1 sulfur oxidation c-type cytochrome SoxX [Roseovarius indicus]QEW26004.1 Cytochrome c [Roseovarius indicus]SFD91724.1 sulfur-oxidizing protein SoxX [Roseovarius indicus]